MSSNHREQCKPNPVSFSDKLLKNTNPGSLLSQHIMATASFGASFKIGGEGLAHGRKGGGAFGPSENGVLAVRMGSEDPLHSLSRLTVRSTGSVQTTNVAEPTRGHVNMLDGSGKMTVSAKTAPALQAPRIATSSVDSSDTLALDNIRDSLIRQEDSIIFNLIERAQFRMNSAAYDPQIISVPGFNGSLLEYILKETEKLHAQVRRFTSPVEHPFFPQDLPPLILPALEYPRVLHPAADDININPIIWNMYFEDLLPAIVAKGDDFNYGSTATMDVLCLQALSRRIHYGKFVAEAKFRESPDLYEPLIRKQDSAGLMDLLTFENVEATVQKRVELKAMTFGQDISVDNSRASSDYKIAPRVVARLYGEWIMPLTKQVQVQYLLRRLD
eukprot:jgi/Mesen1/6105/ME000310S05195